MLTQPHLRRTSGGPKSHYRENKILYYNQSAIKRQDAGGPILQDAEQAWWGNQMVDLWFSEALFFLTGSIERMLENFKICSCPAQMVLEVACVNSGQCRSRGHRLSTYSPPASPVCEAVGPILPWLSRSQPGLAFEQIRCGWRQCSVCHGKPLWLEWAQRRHRQRRDMKALCTWHSSDLAKWWVLSALGNCLDLSPTSVSTPAL